MKKTIKIKGDEKWLPYRYSKPLTNTTRGVNYWLFSQVFLTATRGFKRGKALEQTKWQKWLDEAVFETRPDGKLRYRMVIITMGRKNGKTLKAAIWGLYELLFGGTGAQVISAAKDRKQASVVFDEAKSQIARSPSLKKHLKGLRDRIFNPRTRGVWFPIAADGDRAQGLGPSLVIIDEAATLEGKQGQELIAALTEGSGDRDEYLIVIITTAGYNPDSPYGQLYKQGLRTVLPDGHEDKIDDPTLGFFEWTVPAHLDPLDEENWHMANPNLAEGLYDLEDMRRSIVNPTPFNLTKFMRYRLNMWVRLEGVQLVSQQIWGKARTGLDIPLGANVVLGFDGSKTGDSTGFVIMDLDTGVFKTLKLWENKHAEKSWYVDRDDVQLTLKQTINMYNVRGVWADPSYFEMDLIKWAKEESIQVVKVPSNRMPAYTQRFTSALVYGEIFRREDDDDLTRHTFNAVLREDGGFEKITKSEKVDLLVCAVLANAAREMYSGRVKPSLIPAPIY